jgi:hypothetical protein
MAISELSTSREPETPRLCGSDGDILRLVGRWRKARAQALLVWANHDMESHCGFDEDVEITPPASIDDMSKCARILALQEPRSVLAAREMLAVALTILSHRQLEPDTDWFEGPVFEIIQKVHQALRWTDRGYVLRSVQ